MPPRTTNNGVMPTSQQQQPPLKRFELPTLDFKFGSLTEGTNIPPPLPSPVEEEPGEKETPAEEGGKGTGQLPTPTSPESAAKNNENAPAATTVAKAGTKRPADDIPVSPVSPTLSNRPGSIRRLFSRTLLHPSYANGENAAGGEGTGMGGSGDISRPQSQSNGSIVSSKRGSGWFHRLRGSEYSNKRSSAVLDDAAAASVAAAANGTPAGPPPPMIPELSDLKAKVDLKGTSFSDDLFKNIK